MSQDLTNPTEAYKMSPELLEVTTRYLETSSIEETAASLEISREKVIHYLNKKESKRFIDNVFLDQGYLNKHKLQGAMQSIIDKKIEELDEAELGSNKDIADLLMMSLKMREAFMKETVQEGPKVQNNTQIIARDFGANYNNLLDKLEK